MNRRSFLSLLAGLPVVGKYWKPNRLHIRYLRKYERPIFREAGPRPIDAIGGIPPYWKQIRDEAYENEMRRRFYESMMAPRRKWRLD